MSTETQLLSHPLFQEGHVENTQNYPMISCTFVWSNPDGSGECTHVGAFDAATKVIDGPSSLPPRPPRGWRE